MRKFRFGVSDGGGGACPLTKSRSTVPVQRVEKVAHRMIHAILGVAVGRIAHRLASDALLSCLLQKFLNIGYVLVGKRTRVGALTVRRTHAIALTRAAFRRRRARRVVVDRFQCQSNAPDRTDGDVDDLRHYRARPEHRLSWRVLRRQGDDPLGRYTSQRPRLGGLARQLISFVPIQSAVSWMISARKASVEQRYRDGYSRALCIKYHARVTTVGNPPLKGPNVEFHYLR